MADGIPASRSRRPSGEGSVYRRGDKWVAELQLGRDPVSGRRRRATRQADSERGAAKALRELMRERDAGASFGRIPTLAEHLDEWLEKVAAQRTSPKTLDLYRGLVRSNIRPALGAYRLDQLRPEHVERFFAAEARAGKSASTLAKYRGILGRSMRWALARRLITWDPVAVAEMPATVRKPQEGRALDREEARALVEAARGHRLEAWFVLALTVGLRPGELGALCWNDVDLEAGTVSVSRALQWHQERPTVKPPKTEKSVRVLGLAPSTVASLRNHRRRQAAEQLAAQWPEEWSTLVFRSVAGTPLHPRNLRRLVADRGAAAGLGHLRPYDLRHSALSLLADSGVPIRQVADVAGHTTTRVTERHYVHRLTSSVDAARGPMEELFGRGAG